MKSAFCLQLRTENESESKKCLVFYIDTDGEFEMLGMFSIYRDNH